MNKDHCLHSLLACTGMEDSRTTARVLAVGDSDDCSVLLACRNDENREYIDSVLLPDGVKIATQSDSLLPQHPAVLIRSFDNVQIMLDPIAVRAMAQWLLTAADWLEDEMEGD